MSENLIGVTEVQVVGMRKPYELEVWEENEEIGEPTMFTTNAYVPDNWFRKDDVLQSIIDYFRLDTSKGLTVTDLFSGKIFIWTS